ncbi:unannotated protein [freshwater metagenome]|uniref:Unannotated protein n=1 Tax=freshwater metagenome TaxID=449393 RepID=A0A6J6X2J5_9ZZZZ
MSPDSFGIFISTHNHGRSIPTDEGADTTLNMFVTWKPWFVVAWDGIDVGRGNGGGKTHLTLLCLFQQPR